MVDSKITEEKIKEVTLKIADNFQPEKIILFGSFAWGQPNEDSDVDLFIIKKTDLSTREIAREIDGSIFPRPFPMDIVVYKPEQVLEREANNDYFIKDILTKGKILYAK